MSIRRDNPKGIHVTEPNASADRNFSIGDTFFDVSNESEEKKVAYIRALAPACATNLTVRFVVVAILLASAVIAVGQQSYS